MSQMITELGFVEDDFEPNELTSCFFPSKVGGKPSWLALTGLPTNVKCANCEKHCAFMMQIYCPITDQARCFHRSLFAFVCKDPLCYKTQNACVKIFRSQLPRRNDFYSFEPISDSNMPTSLPSASNYQTLCNVCGCPGTSVCSKCKSVHYCSREHQVVDWKQSHKKVCGEDSKEKANSKSIYYKKFSVD